MPKPWQPDEITYLQDNWAYKSVKLISAKLKRPSRSVVYKARALNLGGAYNSGEHLSANQVSVLLGIDVHTVTDRWIAKYGLKSSRIAMIKREDRRVSIVDLTKWLKDNPDRWNATRLKYLGLGAEPKWLKDKRKADALIPVKANNKWTNVDDSTLISLLRIGLTCEEIGKRLSRPEKGVFRRVSRLRERGKLPKCNVKVRWTEREEEIFRELEDQGMSDVAIAEELGRDREHVVCHRRELRKKGLYEGRKMRASG